MKNLIIFVVILITSNQVMAAEKIIGAFGLELGGLFIPKQMATAHGSMTSGEKIFFFDPDPGYQALTEYYVKISPTTNRIYEIVGEHEYETSLACDKAQETLAGLLKKKYGRINKTTIMANYYTITQHPREINVSCSMFEYRLRITYSDSAIENTAKAEQIETMSNDGSSDGL